jgi:hypothetical protein
VVMGDGGLFALTPCHPQLAVCSIIKRASDAGATNHDAD